MSKEETIRFPVADVLTFLEERAGLVFPHSRMGDVERGIARAADRCGAADSQSLLTQLRENSSLLEELLEGLLIGETYFFREPQQFAEMRDTVLPDLMRGRSSDAPLQIWSAGCASGEEAYSLAIMLEQRGLSRNSHVVASDICAPVLKKAARGNYDAWSLRGAGEEFKRTYFEKQGQKFRLLDRIRERVTFRESNLAGQEYPLPPAGKGFDLILCRNVLIYFSPDAIAQVSRKLFDSLTDGGWLITAPSDPPLWDFAPYETWTTGAGILYRKTKAAHVQRKNKNKGRARIETKSALSEPRLENLSCAISKSNKDILDFGNDRAACETRAQALFQGNQHEAALSFLSQALVWHPFSLELHYLNALNLLNRDEPEKAAEAARCLAYLDRQSVAAQMLLGTIAQRRGDKTGAIRAYRNGISFCAGAAENEIVPLIGTERYGRVAEALAAEIASLLPVEAA